MSGCVPLMFFLLIFFTFILLVLIMERSFERGEGNIWGVKAAVGGWNWKEEIWKTWERQDVREYVTYSHMFGAET